ncbi:sigma-70 family RNA polymerase sigma factor [Streptomyces sp. NPDC005728]|uniref:sigma-70 family RNA polymerase sigma factor n=1 Tax=Streptomyces sp. NPDC005728 TaxID=3157054 RepID=UPI0033CFEF1A
MSKHSRGPGVQEMDDREIVAAIRAADPQGLAAAYDTYAGRLYGYCRSVLHSPDAADDALQDTFVLANERIGQLRDPGRLRPWLYAIARHECLHQLRGERRTTGIEAAEEVSDESVDLDAQLRTQELRSLVRDAFAGLNTRDREVLELATRQGLEGGDLAAVLGLSLNHTHALLSRARGQLEKSVAALIVARNGRQDCAELAEMLEGWDGTMTVLLRKRISRHIGQCEVCGERKDRDVRASALLSLLPFPVLPSTLRNRTFQTVLEPTGAGHRMEVARRATQFDQNGFPMLPGAGTRWLTPIPAKVAAAGLMGAAVLIGGPLLWATEGAEAPGRPVPGITSVPPRDPVPTPPGRGEGPSSPGAGDAPSQKDGPSPPGAGEPVPTPPEEGEGSDSSGVGDGPSPSEGSDSPGAGDPVPTPSEKGEGSDSSGVGDGPSPSEGSDSPGAGDPAPTPSKEGDGPDSSGVGDGPSPSEGSDSPGAGDPAPTPSEKGDGPVSPGVGDEPSSGGGPSSPEVVDPPSSGGDPNPPPAENPPADQDENPESPPGGDSSDPVIE